MMGRRRFMAATLSGLFGLAIRKDTELFAMESQNKDHMTKVALVKTFDRSTGIPEALQLLGINPVQNKKILIKPNFNTADPFPASTHNDTLITLIQELKKMGALNITIGERCGPPDTADVLRDKGIYQLAKNLGVGLINFEELPDEEWVRVNPKNSHWRDGFEVAKPVIEAECIVSTCCLKTHAYGGVFTMSLKLSVGLTRKSNMMELHSSFLSMRKMIAEINQAYSPSLILLDGIEAFTDGGPSRGKLKSPGVLLAGTDRIAIDAVGLAILKEVGSNDKIMNTKIFEQEQIQRAVELGLGINNAKSIEIVPAPDQDSQNYGKKLQALLVKES